MLKKIIYLCFAVSITLFPRQNKELGFPQLKNYTPKEFGALSQNWAITQDKRGIMYFGNVGVLEYDGVNWRLISLPNMSTVRSLGCSEAGRIYVGGVGDFGYLQPDSKGEFKFFSLVKYLPEESKNFADVWSLFIKGSEIFFTTDAFIFRWSEKTKKMKTWKAENKFHVCELVNGIIYIREWGKGLLTLDGDSLKLIPGSEQFADERIYAMLAMPGGKNILFVTRTKGLFLFDGKKFKQFKTEADEYLKQNLIYMPGVVLSDGNLALGTLTGGLIIISPEGKILNIFNTHSGLVGNTVYYVYQDRTNAIWLALDGGITRLDYGSAATFFDARKGLDQAPYKLQRYNGILYAATNSGIYYLNPATSNFTRIINSPVTQCFDMISFKNQLLAGTNEGVFKIVDFKAVPLRKSINKDYEVGYFLRSKLNPNRIFVATYGLGSLLFKNGKWIDEGIIKNIGQLSTIAETPEGEILTANTVSGINSISFPKSKDGDIIFNKAAVKTYNKNNGLPEGGSNIVTIQNRNYFITPSGIYRFDKEKLSFYRDHTFEVAPVLNGNFSSYYLFEDSTKRVWACGGLEPVVGYPQQNGEFKWLKAPFKRFSDELINTIYPDEKDVVWFASNYGAIRYNLRSEMERHENYSAFIREVSVAPDSIIYFGELNTENSAPQISFSNNSIKFEFSAPAFLDESRNQFKTYLEGFDEKWSGWSREHFKEYTNLPPGNFIFHVKGINAHQVASSEASFAFVILSPWYRTWWAYVLYVIMFAFGFFAVDRFQRKRLLKKEREKIQLREIKLRAEKAEAENERKRNIELLSEIGKDITANLSTEQIIDTVYANVNSLMDAAVFGIGIYDEASSRLVFPATKEKGISLDTFYNYLNDENRPAVWCFKNQKEIFTNDYLKEHSKYVKQIQNPVAGEHTQSVLYIPLNYKNKKIGVITAQSFKKDAYNEYHLNILRNLATYTAIAVDNADAYRQLNETVNKLDTAIQDLKSTQEKLIVQQKLASLGQLTAGIAHEIKNPLNFVNNFAQLSIELVNELRDEISCLNNNIEKGKIENIEDLLSNIEGNVSKINEHGRRADSIVKSMLQHSRGKAGEKIPSDINAILEEDLNLAYHGMRAQNSEFNISIKKEFDENAEKINIVQQEISRVFLNIIQNGFYETHRKKLLDGKSYNPCICVRTEDKGDNIEIRIRDNGNGIPDDIRDKIFDPFFTTKPTGQGTGLGLSLSYDIVVKQHSGEIKFETAEGKFTEFLITLPKNNE
jgi:signal transduction histidine kinase